MEKKEELQTCYEAIATFGTTKQISMKDLSMISYADLKEC